MSYLKAPLGAVLALI